MKIPPKILDNLFYALGQQIKPTFRLIILTTNNLPIEKFYVLETNRAVFPIICSWYNSELINWSICYKNNKRFTEGTSHQEIIFKSFDEFIEWYIINFFENTL